jgi:hypothetical protein
MVQTVFYRYSVNLSNTFEDQVKRTPYMLAQLARGSRVYANRFNTDSEAASGWRSLEKKITGDLASMDASTKHLNDINVIRRLILSGPPRLSISAMAQPNTPRSTSPSQSQ